MPKQYADFEGKALLSYSVKAMVDSDVISNVVVVIGAGQEDMAKQALGDLAEHVALITGGETRRDSVKNGLDHIAKTGSANHVFIHDAARPKLTDDVLHRLNEALDNHKGAVPALPMVDSVSLGENGTLGDALNRDKIWRIQTPQAFHFDAIIYAHEQWPQDKEASDDARMAQAMGYDVAIVEGDEALKKITFAQDFTPNETDDTDKIEANMNTNNQVMICKSGIGYDVHRLKTGEELWLCGVQVPHDKGLSGHSDADVALHAITDAVLGAMALGDIGQHFPPSDPKWKGASSDQFLHHAANLVSQHSGKIVHIDVTIICEAPKIAPWKDKMRDKIAEILGMSRNAISVKATTTERLGFAGRGEGIAAQAIATVQCPLY